MKAIAFPLLWCALSLSGIAQNLSVTFSGAGTATQIDSVTATNLRTNQWITLPGDGTLILGVSTGVSTISELAGPGIVFPNPFAGKTTYTMNSEIPQTVYLSIQNLAGQVVAQSKAFIQPGENEFTLSVNIAGYYTVGLTSDQGTTNYKVICIEAVSPESSIQYQGSVSNNHNNHNNLNTQSQGGLKSSQTTYILDYTSGDVIHYRCMSGIYTTIVTDSPAYNKNYEVEFAACTDSDGKNYSIVKVGDQFWMAENLAYLPEVSSSSTGSDTIRQYYVYGYDGTNIAAAKENVSYETYGVLYNWTAAMNGAMSSTLFPSGVKGHCPEGWHLPGDAEWKFLTDFLQTNGGNKLKSTFGWAGNGNGDNSTGFNTLPGGFRGFYGGFEGSGAGAYFWSASEESQLKAWGRYLYYISDGSVYRFNNSKSLGLSVRCLRGFGLPTVTTAYVSEITLTSATCGGEVINDGGAPVTERGVCWNTSPDPTIADRKTSDGSGNGVFSSYLTDLTPGTPFYYVRAYAINSVGTSYGEEKPFNTQGEVYLPRVITSKINWIAEDSVNCGGNVTFDGGAAVTARGVCWNTSGTPTISNNKTIDGSGTGVYTSVLSGLAQATTYHARAYATNSGGTAYGEEVVFRTWDIGVFTDERDGHQYRRARIGDQVWMAENLAWLPAVYPSSSGSETEKRYYVYDYQGTNINEAKTSQNYSTYGVLYNWAAAMNGGVSSNLVPSGVQGACPAGWHLPSFAEFDIFQRYLGDNAGIRLRESGNTHWVGDNVATNEFGFTALPSGSRYLEDGFQNKGYETVFRTATAVDISSSYYVKLAIYTTTLPIGGAKKGYGDAVRCIKN